MPYLTNPKWPLVNYSQVLKTLVFINALVSICSVLVDGAVTTMHVISDAALPPTQRCVCVGGAAMHRQ
jgi:hypothetical protein